MYERIQMVLGGLVLALFGLSALSRRLPNVAWLQIFRFELPQLSEEQRARMRRRANVLAGAKLILMGIALPMGYVVITVMMFNDLTTRAMTLVLMGSVLCILLGITAIVRSRKD